MGIRAKLILVLGLVLGVAFVSTSLIGFMVTKSSFRTSSLDETLPLISNNILSEIQTDLMMPVHVSSLMANDTFLKDWARTEEDMAPVVKYLREIKNRYHFFSAFFVSERTGRYYYYDGVLKTLNPQDPHDVWYYDFKKKNVALDLDVDTDEASAGTLTIFINHRLNDDQGRLLGVTGVGLNMDQIGRILAQYHARYRRMVYLIDDKGLIEVHPDAALVEKVRVTDSEVDGEIFRTILKQKAAIATYEIDRPEGRVFLAARYFPRFNWFLIVEQSEDPALKPIRSAFFANLGLGLLATVVILVIVVLVVNHFQRRLEFLASVDELTGLTNRRVFLERLNAEAIRAARYERPFSLLVIDADHFKPINDRYGHPMGDRALVHLARSIREALRESDVPGRLGGEEFGVLLPETGIQEAAGVAERVRARVETAPLETEAGTLALTISVGAAVVRPGSGAVEDLLFRADQAMYRSKLNGRNRVTAEE